MSRVFITGGSGFVGSAILHELLRRGHSVSALVNRKGLAVSDANVSTFQGTLSDADMLDQAMAGCDAVIHTVGIIREQALAGITFDRVHRQGTQNVADAAIRNGVRRFVQMSALGVRPAAVSDYHRTKFQAEQYLRAAGLDWTIFRPSLIHGPGGEFMRMEAAWARGRAPPPLFVMPFMPYFGGKRAGRLQPVYVGDVARAFVDALDQPRTVGELYPIGGPDELTWPQLHTAVAQAVVGHPRLTASIPVTLAMFLASVGLGTVLGFNRDQVIMSQEPNITDMSKFLADFGWAPRSFLVTLNEYAHQL